MPAPRAPGTVRVQPTMHHLLLAAATIAALSSTVAAQAPQKSLLFTGRFPFVSLDATNERPGGSVNALDEFDFSWVTPAQGAFARSLRPATAHQALLGDGDSDGNYLKFYNFKTYFEALQFGGVFVKHADKQNLSSDRVYFTVRDNVATKQFEVQTNSGTAPQVLRPGDFVRLLPNGNVEIFLNADQLDVAAGLPPAGQSSTKGAHALAQDAQGNLYYSPVQGGHWVNGNGPTPVFANDGAICFVPASAINYDAQGNVQAIAPNSARLLWEEIGVGSSPSGTSVRGMVLNSGGMARDGTPLQVTGVFGKVSGLDLDPNGGLATPAYPDNTGAFPQVPNLVFCSDAGSYGGTIFSTNNNGSLATLNGVLCGSNIASVPATGSWLGVQLDLVNFQPSLMGLQVVDAVQAQPFVLDAPSFGAITTTAPAILVDGNTTPLTVAFLLASLGPAGPGGTFLSIPSSSLPIAPLLLPGSFSAVYPFAASQTLGLAVTDANGYFAYSSTNPHTGAYTGLTLVLQAVALNGAGFQISTPLTMQLK